MGSEANRALVRRYYDEVLNEGRIEALDELAVGDYEEHDPLPGQGTGRGGLKDRVATLRDALAETFTVEDVIAEGDRVAVRWSASGRHVGDFMGMPASGRPFTMAGIDIHRLRDGRMSEHWHVVDQLALLQQLGALAQPEQATA
jgi:steroid delta-isomerase-like uncharacterized protein